MKRTAVFLLILSTILFCQTGKIKGKVTDNQNNPLQGALISVIGTSWGAETDTEGNYLINGVGQGVFDIKCELKGYITTEVKNIKIRAGQTITQNFKLKIQSIEIGKVEEERLKKDKASNEKKEALMYEMDAMAAPSVSGTGMIMRQEAGDQFNTEEYSSIKENNFKKVTEDPLSTFSIDVDAASYANVRRFLLQNNQLPYADAVRIEEMINYFDYDYKQPEKGLPFSLNTEISDCPWNKENKLVHIGLQGRKMEQGKEVKSNFVFLLDVSGSMEDPNKLPLLKKSFGLLIDALKPSDRIAIVVYAGAAGVVLPSTEVKNKKTILDALNKLSAGGSTAGGQGIKLAYDIADKYLIKNGNNRIILATDGDFNVGVSSTSELVKMMEEKRNKGIFITVLGFGMGNYKDSRLEEIADKGNGNYYYIDGILEAKKVLVTELAGTMFTIAKDVKLQIEFNPAKVESYRLVGYENRLLNKEDFDDDKKDAGELGAGHTVTALYEIVPAKGPAKSDNLKYQAIETKKDAYTTDEIMNIKLRYKEPKEDQSKLIQVALKYSGIPLAKSSDNFRFSAAVAEFGMLLRDSQFKKDSSYNQVLELAKGSKSKDDFGYRAEFVQLVEKAKLLKK
ncbi:MAG TPA: von Willebrand factor type A domain-containing protein [Clostridiales bacterium]|nr:von Willebrand factor type A domain-containing protein [Clostridiales bacterium]HQP69026.1 von Willebrand factor type A domain-containing protein [Clostridiales bacterium]